MTTTITGEYRQLGYDTSNDMIRHDVRRTDRKYEEAALHIRDAGLGRLRMGQMMFDAGEFAHAAEDWLSAAACFYLVPDLKRMEEATERVRKLDREGKIPPERGDLHAALKEREGQLVELDRKEKQFRTDYERMTGSKHAASQEVLDWLLQRIRDFPGDMTLHATIVNQAMRLGLWSLASSHLEWAEKLEPGYPQLEAFRVMLLLFSGGHEAEGIRRGRTLLQEHPEMDVVRSMLAQFIAFPARGVIGDWEEALKVLQPLVGSTSTPPKVSVQALALALLLRHGLGHDAEYRRILSSFEQLVEVLPPQEQSFVASLRRDFPQVFPQPGSNGTPTPNKPDYGKVRNVFSPHNALAGAVA